MYCWYDPDPNLLISSGEFWPARSTRSFLQLTRELSREHPLDATGHHVLSFPSWPNLLGSCAHDTSATTINLARLFPVSMKSTSESIGLRMMPGHQN